jgi:hypothetical protein
MSSEKVDDYIRGLPVWQSEIVMALRGIVKDAAPEAAEAFKWSQPVYEVNGPFCYMKAFKKAVNFGFWRGAELDDPAGLLQGSGEKMRHVKLSSIADMSSETFADYVRQAVQLNLTKGDPTKPQ